MTTEKLLLADPYNDKHIEMFEEFEVKNKINPMISDFLKTIKNSKTRCEYIETKKTSNEIEESLFVLNNLYITDSCHIHGEKDIKLCKITLAPIKQKERKILDFAIDYVFNSLGMQEVFINAHKNDNSMNNLLNNRGFENLGEENDIILYLKEKDEKINVQRTLQ